jgi:uncharacterized phage protein (TIGR02220 family)
MGKFKRNRAINDFTIVCNSFIRDDRLSYGTKGIMLTLLSLPEDWDYSIKGLVSLSTDGETKVRNGLSELTKYGYLERKPVRDEKTKKIIDWDYILYEKPQEKKPLGDLPQVENLVVANLDVANQAQLNTKELNTNIYISKENNKEKLNLANEIIAYLNAKTGKKFTHTNKETLKHINGRLSEGATLEDFKKVIDIKCSQWLGDPRMEEYLRPSTLFAPSKFESYLNTKLGEQKYGRNENIVNSTRFSDEYSDER